MISGVPDGVEGKTNERLICDLDSLARGKSTPMSELSRETASPTVDLGRVIAFGLFGAGIALLICRYALFPLTGGPMRIMVGFAIGAFVGGRQLLKNGTDVPNRIIEVSAMAGAGALVAAVIYLGFAPPPLAESPLSVVKAPGMRVSLPGKAVVEGEHRHGQIQVRGIVDQGAVAISWQPGVALLEDELQMTMEALGKEFGSRASAIELQRTVSGHPSTSSMMSGDIRSLATAWSCEPHGRGFFVMTRAEASIEEIKTLHGRILDSVECHIGPAPEAQWVLPSFPDEIEVGYVPDSDPPTFFTSKGEVLMFSVAALELPGQLKEHPNLVRIMFENTSESELQDFDLSPGLHPVVGRMRAVWHAIARLDGDPYWTELSAFKCDSFSLTVVSLRSHHGEELPVSEALLAAACPKPGSEPPRTAREVAKDVCLRGDLVGCAVFTEAGLEVEELEGWLGQACDAGIALACEALEPATE